MSGIGLTNLPKYGEDQSLSPHCSGVPELRLCYGLKNTVVECAKTRKYPKPDPTRIFRVFWCLTRETWNLTKWNLARPWPEFSVSGFFSGFSGFEDYVAHPTNTHREVWKNFAKLLLLLLLLSCTNTAAAIARRSKPFIWAAAASPRNSFVCEALHRL